MSTLFHYNSKEQFKKREAVGKAFEQRLIELFEAEKIDAKETKRFSHTDIRLKELDVLIEAKVREYSTNSFKDFYLPKRKLDALAGTKTLVYQHFTKDDKHILLNCQHIDPSTYELELAQDYGAKTDSYKVPKSEFSFVEPDEFVEAVISGVYFETDNPSLTHSTEETD